MMKAKKKFVAPKLTPLEGPLAEFKESDYQGRSRRQVESSHQISLWSFLIMGALVVGFIIVNWAYPFVVMYLSRFFGKGAP